MALARPPRGGALDAIELLSTPPTPNKGRKSVLYWGPEKTGKTFLALTWPNPLMIQLDHNWATLQGHPGVPVIAPGSVRDLTTNILPAIRNRQLTELVRSKLEGFSEYTVETIIIDSYTALDGIHQEELTGAGKMEFSHWATHKRMYEQLTQGCASATKTLASQPGETYNFIATVHETIDKDEESGRVLAIWPSVDGSFKKSMRQYFDAVLITDFKLEKQPKGPPKGNFFVHTSPPDSFRKCGIGGKGLKFPAHCQGDYTSLMKHWAPREKRGDS